MSTRVPARGADIEVVVAVIVDIACGTEDQTKGIQGLLARYRPITVGGSTLGARTLGVQTGRGSEEEVGVVDAVDVVPVIAVGADEDVVVVVAIDITGRSS